MAKNTIKVCIVKDNSSYRDFLKFTLSEKKNVKVVGGYESGLKFINGIRNIELPDVCLIDLH